MKTKILHLDIDAQLKNTRKFEPKLLVDIKDIQTSIILY